MWINDVTEFFGASEKTKDEVLHYARVLAARGMPEEYIILAVTKYARLRGEYDGRGYD